MRKEEFSELLNEINDNYIKDAHETKNKKQVWLKWGAIAACLCLVAAGAIILGTNDVSTVSIGGITRNYKDVIVMGSESAMEWPWEYKTLSEQYTTTVLDDKEYNSSGRSVDVSLIGDSLGIYEVVGYDTYSEEKHQMTAEAYQIVGVSIDNIITVKLDDEFYVFKCNECAPPADFGEVLDTYNLTQMLSFEHFTEYESYTATGYYSLENDTYIWEILNTCRSAEFIHDDNWNCSEREYLSFTVTSDALGVYKRAFYITNDGYIWTNIFDYAYIFQIGEEAAEKIIAYATENGVESEMEPYTYSLAGTLVKVADDYILVDDTILCTDEKEGMVFKVPMDSLCINRCINFEKISDRDIVVVYFTGNINIEEGNVVEGAYSLVKGTISNSEVSIQE